MKNKVLIIALIAATGLAGFFTSCEYLSPLIDYFGIVLKTDDLNHFEEDTVYKDGVYTYRFMQNGDYEFFAESFEGTGEDYDGDGIFAEGWVRSSGEKGTYTWDPTWFELRRIINQTLSAGEWTALVNTVIYTDSIYFGEHNFSPVWINGTTYDFDSISGTGWQNSRVTETENLGTETSIRILEVQGGGDLNYFYHYTFEDTAGTTVTDSQTLRQADYDIFPTDTEIAKSGERFTLRATVHTTCVDSLDNIDNDEYVYTWDFISSEFWNLDFWIEWPEEASLRGLF